jgi:hypothetical protein
MSRCSTRGRGSLRRPRGGASCSGAWRCGGWGGGGVGVVYCWWSVVVVMDGAVGMVELMVVVVDMGGGGCGYGWWWMMALQQTDSHVHIPTIKHATTTTRTQVLWGRVRLREPLAELWRAPGVCGPVPAGVLPGAQVPPVREAVIEIGVVGV